MQIRQGTTVSELSRVSVEDVLRWDHGHQALLHQTLKIERNVKPSSEWYIFSLKIDQEFFNGNGPRCCEFHNSNALIWNSRRIMVGVKFWEMIWQYLKEAWNFLSLCPIHCTSKNLLWGNTEILWKIYKNVECSASHKAEKSATNYRSKERICNYLLE